ncbi:Forkhead-associated (FHA) domain [Trypanosoma melophagium]|uniref:Forkhead-associated (FHA) domain n=1 Tax=Trypanosoma melophagium TaxID=715481 RepID=UPI00351A3644|nr:Forkhead-associated (FHA) domain [Trypanosoma melophagium]
MVEYLNAALVLTRGPALLPRRLSVRVRTDGTPLSIGRAQENDLVLDANLLFASQHHCQLLVQPVSTSQKELAVPVLEGKEGKKQHQRQQQQQQALELCLVDFGSSNGTFINGIRLENDAITPLHHGDVIVLGGMRDVAAGASLPQTCGPEIVMWRIALDDNDNPFAFEETPAVFLSPDYIEAEEKRMTLNLLLQQAAIHSPQRAVSSVANCDSLLKDAPPPTVVKSWCSNRDRYEQQQLQQQQEEQQQSPQTPVAREVLRNSENDDNTTGDGKVEIDISTRRSGTVAATVEVRGKSTEWRPPTTVRLRAVHLDRSNFKVLQTSPIRCNPKRLRGHVTGGKTDNNNSLQPHKLTLTQEHWEWTMNESIGAVKKKGAGRKQQQQCAVHCTIPWSNVERIMYCTSQRAITVLLQEGTASSLHRNNGTKHQHQFATWLVDEPKAKENTSTTAYLHEKDTFQHLLAELSRLSHTDKKPKPEPLEEHEFIARYAPVI